MEAIIYTRPSCDQWAKACSCMNLQNIWPTQPFPIHMQRKNDRDMWATFSNCVVYAISTLKFNLKIQECLFRYFYWTVKYNQCLPSFILEFDLESPVLLVLWFSTNVSISWFSYFLPDIAIKMHWFMLCVVKCWHSRIFVMFLQLMILIKI